MKTLELTGRALDWAVAVAVGAGPVMRHDHLRAKAARNNRPKEELAWHLNTEANDPIIVSPEGGTRPIANYCWDWDIAGLIIAQERITIRFWENESFVTAYKLGDIDWCHGDTPVVAAMRCYVQSRLGNEVEIPEELK